MRTKKIQHKTENLGKEATKMHGQNCKTYGGINVGRDSKMPKFETIFDEKKREKKERRR